MNILITGASGFIGQHLCNTLFKYNIDFHCICRHQPSFEYPYSTIDILNFDTIFPFINDNKPNIIVHLAAIANPIYNDIFELYRANVGGTENILKAVSLSNYYPKIILASSAGVYGNQNIDFYSENCPPAPNNHYACSKLSMEFISQNYAKFSQTTIVRLFNIIGTGQNTNFIVPKFIKSFVDKKQIIEVGNISTIRDYVDVDYCCNIFFKLITSDDCPKLLNICSGIGYSGNDIINRLINLTNFQPELKVNNAFIRDNDIQSLIGNPSILNKFMNSNYKIDLDHVLTFMYNYYQAM